MSEFQQLIEDAQLTDETLATRDVRLAFLYSRETHVCEVGQDFEHLRKPNFCEFIEAISRIADMKDFTSMYAQFQSDSLELDPSVVQVFHDRQRDASEWDWKANTGSLSYKITLLIAILKTCLKKNMSKP